jgi:hypothetical protein
VLDLRVLGRRELPLLDIARRERVEILALGRVPLGLAEEDLEGVELVSAEELVRRLRGPDEPADAPPPEETGQTARGGAADDAEPARPEPEPDAPDEASGPEAEAPAPAATDGRDRTGPAELSDEDLPDELIREMEEDIDNGPPHSVLTPEELAALLEDRS